MMEYVFDRIENWALELMLVTKTFFQRADKSRDCVRKVDYLLRNKNVDIFNVAQCLNLSSLR